MSQFNTGGEFLNVRSLVGKLVIVAPYEHDRNVKTKEYGVKDGIRADVVVLSDENGNHTEGETYDDVLFMQGKLIGRLKRSLGQVGQVGKLFLGVVQEENPGVDKTPMFFGRVTDADKAHASAYIARTGFTQRVTETSAVAPAAAPTQAQARPAAAPAAAPVQDPAVAIAALQAQLAALTAAPAAVPAPAAAQDDPWA